MVPTVWGASTAEVVRPYPCDAILARPSISLFRAVTVNAAPATVFRWLCQLKIAPYSYDVLDNRGRRSPRTLSPGVEDLAVGQRLMRIFTLVDFERDVQLTLRLTDEQAHRAFGDLAVTYLISPVGDQECRLIAKLVVPTPRTPLHRLRRALLAWGDLLMMRRQLLNLRDLANRS
jgi:hypothetical protein